MSQPAARIFDLVMHPVPGTLMPGPGSPNVLIGSLPAWRGLPAAAAMALQAAKAISDTVLEAANAAKLAAAGTPGAPAAIAAEKAAQAAATAAMTSLMNGLGAACAALGGTPDTHICATPPLPPPPHGPGMVIDGSPTVLINGLPACAVGDSVLEALGPLDKIVMGMPTVLIGKKGGGGAGGLASFLGQALSGLGSFLADAVAFVKSLAQQVIDAASKAIASIGEAIANAVKSAAKFFAEAFEKAWDAVRPSRVKGMPAREADEAIKTSQADAVAALDKRIADLDNWDPATEASFKRWFGETTPEARAKMRERMVKARDRLNGFDLDNYESDDDAYAYVYPDDDETMYLGEGFADAPEKGRDSRAGTMVHEASHYDSVGGTDDVEHDGGKVYGEAGAEKLAKDDPANAQHNADNFEYFVEDGM